VQEGNGNSAAKGRRDYGERLGGFWMLSWTSARVVVKANSIFGTRQRGRC
jgi:hypothetical protein